MAFVCLFLQHRVEKRIEAREIRIKAKRENTSEALEKYFKKKEQKFDKVNFLGDIYKLIQAHTEDIKKQIEEAGGAVELK